MTADEDRDPSHLEDALLRHFAKQAFDQAKPNGLGVAVSGGSDSMALLYGLAEASRALGFSIRAATVDHRLRPEAAAEAAAVAQICANLGIPHEVLVWDHDKLRGNLMQAASAARYGLLSEWAKANSLGCVALAHTANDQAETFLMGLARSSGLDGLSGMRRSFVVDQITFLRPFLSLTREELRQFLRQRGLSWIDDPSNDNERFTRVKARRVLNALQPLGITVDHLAEAADHLAHAQSVVQRAVWQAGQDIVSETAGSLSFELGDFRRTGPEISRRLLIGMVRWMNGDAHPPRGSKIATLVQAVDQCRDATLGGVRFTWKGNRCTVMREARAFGPAVTLGQVWDHRWKVVGTVEGEVRAVGIDGLAQIPDWRLHDLPRGVAMATPGVWDGERLISAPLLHFGVPCHAIMTPSFFSFLLSH